MFIFVAYKDAPELSHFLRRSSTEVDPAVEKTLLVNPDCPVRVMLEYIRKKCKLAIFTQFDLAAATGQMKGLFKLPSYSYATDEFEHKKTYYLIVLKQEADKRISVLPQLNHENILYQDIKTNVKKFLLTGDTSPAPTLTPPQSKTNPAAANKPSARRK